MAAEQTVAYRQLPEASVLEAAGPLMIKNENGEELPFNSLYTGKADDERQIIIFLRHFFCGACDLYVQAIADQLPPSTLSSVGANLVFIGCGGPDLISGYRKRLNCPFPVYCDPSRKLYKQLGMPETNSPISEGYRAKQPDYHDKSFFNVVATSFWNVITTGPKAVHGGPSGQNGGVMLFKAGQLEFCHRMRDTGDYLQPRELKSILAIKA